MLGTTNDVNLTDININSNDVVWSYNDANWSCNFSTTLCNQFVTLTHGSGFWIKTATDKNITLPDSTNSEEKNIYTGWNMFSPVLTDLNISDKYSSTNAYSIWTYTYDNGWKLWTPDNAHAELGLQTITSIKQYEGVWLNSKVDILNTYLTIGDKNSSITNGVFSTVSLKYQNQDFSVYNMSLPIDTTALPAAAFDIGIKMNTVEILLKDITITSTTISEPAKVYLEKNGGSAISKSLSNILTYSDGFIHINVKNIYDWAIGFNPTYEPGLGDKTTTIVSDKLIFKNDKKSTSSLEIAPSFLKGSSDTSYLFNIGSSSYEGVINLY